MQLHTFKLHEESVRHVGIEMNQESKKKRLLLGSYFSSMTDQNAKRRYMYLDIIGGLVERKEWKDGIDLWPSITFGMYLLVTPSPCRWENVLELQEHGLLLKHSIWLHG